MLRAIQPVWNLIRLEWNKYKLRTINPLAPEVRELVITINHLERSK